MTHQEALDKLAHDPHVWRYRQLVEDENPRVRDAWRARLVRMVSGEPEPDPVDYESSVKQVPVIETSDPWLPLIRGCDDHNPGCCSHPAAFCTLYLKDVTREQCIACLTERGIVPPD